MSHHTHTPASGRPLPHTTYIEAVSGALTAAKLAPVERWIDCSEARGSYCHLSAVLVLDPSGTCDTGTGDVPASTP